MENNEIMNYENEVLDNEVEVYEMEAENSGISTGAAIAIGAGLTLAVTAGIKLVKTMIAKHKAKKELRLVKEGDFVEVTEEQIQEVAAK
jgi:hypothetical protein